MASRFSAPLKGHVAVLAAFLLCFAPHLRAADPPAEDPAARLERMRLLAKSLKPESGTIQLSGGIAKIMLTDEFKFLNQADSQVVLTDMWKNPPDPGILGLIVPAGFNPLSRGSWVVVISFAEDGYIKDDDASSLNYDKLMDQMKEQAKESNAERVKQGYPEIELVGWAAPPKYDSATHKMYWAKAVRFGKRPVETLNYNIRILGRRGVLVLNAVASMDQLGEIEARAPAILNMVNFSDGNRYADFDSSTDKVATYGLAALVLGGIAAKAGFFKLLLVGLLAAKKFVILAAIAVAGFFKKLYRKFSNKTPDVDGATPPAA